MQVANVNDIERTELVECLVDSGAVHSVIPRETLEQLGIKPFARKEYSLANGELISRERGAAVFKYEGHVGYTDVIFGEPGDASLLGATTLKSMELVLDPFRRELRPLPMILALHTPR